MNKIRKYIYFLVLLTIINCYLIQAIAQSQYNPASQDQSSKPIKPDEMGQSEKYLFPERNLFPNKEFYSLNDSIRVYAEIKGVRFKSPKTTLDSIRLDEIVGNGFRITEHSKKCCVISDIESLINYQDNLSKNKSYEENLPGYSISLQNGFLHVNFNNNSSVTGNDRLVYWYNITPLSYGTFNIKTIIGSETSSNLDYPFSIKVKKAEPIFEVSLTAMKSRAHQFDKIKILYSVNYLGDLDVYENASVIMDNTPETSKYGYFTNQSEISEKKSIKKYETCRIWRTIEFPYTGEYYLPGITIEGVHHSFDHPLITIDNPISGNEKILNAIYLLISIIFAILFIKYPLSTIKSGIGEAFSQIMAIPLIVRILILLGTFIIAMFYLLNLEYIRLVNIILSKSIYLFVFFIVIFMFAYDSKHGKNLFPYVILILLIFVYLLLLLGLFPDKWSEFLSIKNLINL